MCRRVARSIPSCVLPSLLACFAPALALGNVKSPESASGAARDDLLARTLQERCARLWTGNFIKLAESQLPADHPVNQPGLQVVLDLAFKPAGGLSGVSIAAGSGSGDFDRAALEVAQDAARVATRPPALLSDDGLVHARWVLERDEGRCGGFAPYAARLPMPGAIEALTRQGRWDEALARLKEEPSPAAVRVFAAAALRTGAQARPPRVTSAGSEGEPGACESAIPALALEAPGPAREQAVLALRGAMAEACVAPLAAIADSAREPLKVRVAALAALGTQPGDAAEKVLRGHLDAPVPALQAAAVAAWATPERGRKALFALTPLLKHAHMPVRAAAAAGLVRAAGEPALEQLYLLWKESAPEPYEAVAAELSSAAVGGAAAADFLAKMARRSDVRVRLAAALALARRTDEPARAALHKLSGDDDARVRLIAASAGTDAEVLAALEALRGQGRFADIAWAHDALLGGRGDAIAAHLFVELYERGDAHARAALVRQWTAPGAGRVAGAPGASLAAASGR